MRFRIDAIYRHETELGPVGNERTVRAYETVLQLHSPEPLPGQKLNVDHEWGKTLQVGDFLVLGRQLAKSLSTETSFSGNEGVRGEPICVGIADGPSFDIPEDTIIKLLEARGYRVSGIMNDRLQVMKVLGGIVGGLSAIADLETIREAMRTIVETDDLWAMMPEALSAGVEVGEEVLSRHVRKPEEH